MADVLLRFSFPRPPLISPISISLRSDPSRRLGLLNASSPSGNHRSKRLSNLKVHAAVSENEGPKWWEKSAGPNMVDVHSTEDVLNILSQAGDKLVVIEFYGTWCGSCRALFPKICKTAQANPDILFVKVDFDKNKSMCRRLNVRVLPYFQFYRGTELLESFSCSLAKFQKIKHAIATYNTARCSNGPSLGAGDLKFLDTSTPQEKPAEQTPSPNVGR